MLINGVVKLAIIDAIQSGNSQTVADLMDRFSGEQDRLMIINTAIHLIDYIREEGYFVDNYDMSEDLRVYLPKPLELDVDTLTNKLVSLVMLSKYPLTNIFKDYNIATND